MIVHTSNLYKHYNVQCTYSVPIVAAIQEKFLVISYVNSTTHRIKAYKAYKYSVTLKNSVITDMLCGGNFFSSCLKVGVSIRGNFTMIIYSFYNFLWD